MTMTTQKDKLAADMQVVMADTQELLRLTANQAGEGVSAVRGRIEAGLQRAKDDVARLQQAAATRAKEAGRAADDAVHERPWAAIGVALGVGLLIGALSALGRRR